MYIRTSVRVDDSRSSVGSMRDLDAVDYTRVFTILAMYFSHEPRC